jgi:hypothetical protein
MAAAMNGMALHGGLIPYGGTFLMLLRLCAPVDPPASLMGIRVDLRHDARLDRSWRRRSDAPAGRASGGAARHSEPLVFRPADAVETPNAGSSRWKADKAPSALALTRQNLPRCAPSMWKRKPLGQGRLRSLSAATTPRRDDLRHRLGSRDRAQGPRPCSPPRHRDPRSSPCRASSSSSSSPKPIRPGARQVAGQDRRRGRHRSGLGSLHRLGRRFVGMHSVSAPAAPYRRSSTSTSASRRKPRARRPRSSLHK